MRESTIMYSYYSCFILSLEEVLIDIQDVTLLQDRRGLEST